MALKPVLLGGDIGIYAIARSFHEAYGVKSTVVGRSPIDAIEKSRIIETRHAVSSDDSVLDMLDQIAVENPGDDLVLMANSDLHAQMFARHRERLMRHYALPFPDLDTFNLVSDKASFARLCDSVGVATPRTIEVNFAGINDDGWSAPEINLPYPLVAKAASGAAYDTVSFPGKKKIWYIQTADELQQLWGNLRESGFKGTFLVQELIPGDNTAMRSITAYVDSHGEVTMLGSARVLLEDHAPTMIGNPVAMITEPFPQLLDDAKRILKAANYRGFANFDVKIDPRDGTPVFFEVNPRIGRNSYYMTAGSINPMYVMVQDLIQHEQLQPQLLRDEVLYSLVPGRLLRHYLSDDLATRAKALQPRAVDPLIYDADASLPRLAVVYAQKMNQYRKFKRYYPHATDTSF